MSLHDLERQWRERATEAAADGDHATSKAMRQCATELRAALAAGGEAVGEAHSMPGADGFTMASFHAVDVPPGTKLFTHPEGAVQVTDETGRKAAWLVESTFRGPQPMWWNGVPQGFGQSFTADHTKAVRFSRKQDAEAVSANMHMTKATEHVWLAATLNPGGSRE